MKRTKRNTVLKAFEISLIISLIAFFVVDSPKPNTAVYLLFVGIVSFASLNIIYLITSKAYKKFLRES
ncbi:hypothetical protein F3157_20265 [Virgibacillus dakarensis]|uniref:Uncharacterized protein n=1 Tax=Lentibacillus populi TaxID=1827502 RepID=A0A9W5U142_9BACI|nr:MULTISPECIES: hypothetical protein [Bacillaceae]MBT2214658.1 hypothetical protein [Virgibacillus dakarensis]MTW87950.1 hypothetical protein [Virgibacillus dakarensis]GGB58218.1 hypothetical protein GCM10011409_39660 [Lentibacillus populi]